MVIFVNMETKEYSLWFGFVEKWGLYRLMVWKGNEQIIEAGSPNLNILLKESLNLTNGK